ncbi:prepilin-type N-terminal cleavage/methylation domain-containing protein [Diaphorobacter sp. HDW4A]|uniref:GspH/FimT family pseudopilin n=1 Tax=Diaphorobacter sp. HDW4A TaxID=2714924 RepID=UPI00140A3FD1|nr:GspH/FimT family pseudopilin [Diaphorobacter sp. HDW4A]QIL78593.1 prepilin-type N-terminal cleavage/methylation domain-containing protein [Diaphorobacter sp. HDW4A]
MCIRLDYEKGAGVLKPLRSSRRMAGFTMVELMTAISILAILLGLAVPSLTEWVRNNKVRAVANALQNGFRSARADALSRGQPVVLFLTDAKVDSSTSSFSVTSNGKYWATLTVPGLMVGETAALLNSGVLGDVAEGVTISGPSAICFNSLGRLSANASPGPSGGACSLPTTANESFDITMTGAKRRLRVLISTGGTVRMCDRDKDISKYPDGCPT